MIPISQFLSFSSWVARLVGLGARSAEALLGTWYAVAFAVSAATVYAMCSTKKLPHVRLGTDRGAIRFPADATAILGGDGRMPGTEAAPAKLQPPAEAHPDPRVPVRAEWDVGVN